MPPASWTMYIPLIVGFGAVVLASIGQVILERFRSSHQRKREAAYLRRAMIEELRTHREMIDESVTQEQIENPGDGELMIPINRFMPIFDRLFDKLGVLESDEVATVFRAYANLNLMPKSLSAIGRVKEDSFSSWLIIPAVHIAVAHNMNVQIIQKIDAAISCLEKRVT